MNFIEDGCHSKEVEEFDFKFGQHGYENGAGNEIRFEWTNFVWRGFTNIQGKLFCMFIFYEVLMKLYQVINQLLAVKSNNTVAMLKSVEEMKSALHHVLREL